MALTAASGLSTAQKDRLQRFDPVMDPVNAIPAAIATTTDVNNVIADLASTASGKGASCIGYEGGTTVQAQVAANTSAISALGGGGSTGFDAETAGAGGKMQLYEATANGTNKVTMASPASLAADRTITVPDADVDLGDIATNTNAITGAVATSAGGGDAGKLAVLDGAGKWDSSMIPASPPSAHASSHTNGTDDIQSATAGQKGLATAAQIAKLDGIEALADVTDATNVDAAGAVMNSDTSTAAMQFVIDEDNMASDSATKVPTQQSVKAYVTSSIVDPRGRLSSANSPVLLYHFDGTLNDESGNAQHMSAEIGSALYYPTLRYGGQCLYLNGASRMSVAANAIYQILGDVTLMALIRLRRYAGDEYIIAPWENSDTEANNTPYSIRLANGVPIWMAENGAGNNEDYSLGADYVVPLHEWIVLGATRASNVIQFYLDGRPFGPASGAETAPTGGSTCRFGIGAHNTGGGGGYANCEIAGVKVIASALTAGAMLTEAQAVKLY